MPKRQLINDDRLLITDGVHRENTEEKGGPQADGEVKSDICYWQKFNYGWHKLKTMCEVLSQCRMRHNE